MRGYLKSYSLCKRILRLNVCKIWIHLHNTVWEQSLRVVRRHTTWISYAIKWLLQFGSPGAFRELRQLADSYENSSAWNWHGSKRHMATLQVVRKIPSAKNCFNTFYAFTIESHMAKKNRKVIVQDQLIHTFWNFK